ncbi:hypothetical protein O0L34_g1615 [Tuta absoluta]|nr:hypothetical protein O0L34_g1615 [Tuta absoluta]
MEPNNREIDMSDKCTVNGDCSPPENKRPSDFNHAKNIDDIATPSDLKFDEEFDFTDPEILEKRKEIEKCLENCDLIKLEDWQRLARSKGGLISDEYRRKIWPLLVGVTREEMTEPPSLEELSTHPEYNQVVLDVNRSLKRFPPGIPLARRLALQDQLTVLILRVILAYPHLNYYQGYHDVAITLLLVCGARAAFPLLARLSGGERAPLRPFMERTMRAAQHRLNYLQPALQRLNAPLADKLRRSVPPPPPPPTFPPLRPFMERTMRAAQHRLNYLQPALQRLNAPLADKLRRSVPPPPPSPHVPAAAPLHGAHDARGAAPPQLPAARAAAPQRPARRQAAQVSPPPPPSPHVPAAAPLHGAHDARGAAPPQLPAARAAAPQRPARRQAAQVSPPPPPLPPRSRRCAPSWSARCARRSTASTTCSPRCSASTPRSPTSCAGQSPPPPPSPHVPAAAPLHGAHDARGAAPPQLPAARAAAPQRPARRQAAQVSPPPPPSPHVPAAAPLHGAHDARGAAPPQLPAARAAAPQRPARRQAAQVSPPPPPTSPPLRPFMERTMRAAQHRLNYLQPALQRLNAPLADKLRRAGVGTMFALPWFLTWFGHSLPRYADVVRLYDYFLSAPALFPVYVTAALVAHREDDVLATDDDMASLHCMLSRLPDALPFEDILRAAQALHDAHPPEELEPDVIRLEAEEETQRRLDEERMKRRAAARASAGAGAGGVAGGGGGGWLAARVRRWVPARCRSRSARRYCLAACTVLLGVYVYYRPELWR